MFVVFKHSLQRSLGAMLGWGLSLGLITFYLMALYKPILEQQTELRRLLDAYGEAMLAFFGGRLDIFSPAGYLDFAFFSYIAVVVGFFPIVSGAGLLSTDEERGVLDLLLAYPISRTALFFGRFLALLVSIMVILTLSWIGFALGLPLAELDATPWQLWLPHLSMFAMMVLFGGLSLFLSLLLPKHSWATATAGSILVFNYVVTSMARVYENLETLNKFLPLKYYQGGQAVNGLDTGHFVALTGFGLLFTLLAWQLFLRRDIRVSGEGVWWSMKKNSA
ncbi:MAG: ABC transporter permease [Anaerolineales bacterium]|nr:ABC transporter permease [Anaerolineales bacterium]